MLELVRDYVLGRDGASNADSIYVSLVFVGPMGVIAPRPCATLSPEEGWLLLMYIGPRSSSSICQVMSYARLGC